jgi:hypothetical protein
MSTSGLLNKLGIVLALKLSLIKIFQHSVAFTHCRWTLRDKMVSYIA